MPLTEDYRISPKNQSGLVPITWGQQKCEGGFSVDVLRPYWLLHYVVSGKGTFETGNSSYTVLPSQIFVIHPHQTHCYTADKDNPWHYMWIAFQSDIDLPNLLGTDVFSAPAASRVFLDALSASKLDCGKEEFLIAKLWELMSVLMQIENGLIERPNPYVSAAKDFISQNYSKRIKITDIAKALNLDRTYFSTVFKNQTGMSPQEYLMEYRLERAAEMLVDKQGSVAEVAYLSGYGDIVNFSRMFKKHFGTSPSKYRETILRREGELWKK